VDARDTSVTRPVRALLLAAIVLSSVMSLLPGFLAPYVTPADNNTATFAQPARNYLRYGLLETRLGLTPNTGQSPGARIAFNTHHPPLQSLAAAAVFALTGVSDWAARIYPALCSVGSSLLLFVIWRRHRGVGPAFCAALMMSALPAFGHFGKMLGEEAPTLALGLLTIALYQRWKDAAGPEGAAAWALPWAAGCLSGWAAFHVGPLLMADAAVTLHRQRAKRRRALLVLVLTGVACFALIAAHVAVLTGSMDALMGAARNRTLGPAGGPSTDAPLALRAWLAHEAAYFDRLYGPHGALLLLGGLLAGGVALARREATLAGGMTVVVLAGFGVAHPVIFPWAGRYHDWLLFHLLPLVAVAGAEGLWLLGRIAAGGLRLARVPDRIVGAATAGLIVAGLAGHALVSARQADVLRGETTGYAWPLVGREVARLTAKEAHIMANFPFRDAPLRFYADRPSSTVKTTEAFDQLSGQRPYELYVRDLNVPIAPELERLLGELACREVAAFVLCALVPGSATAVAIAPEAAAIAPRQWMSAPLEAAFGTALRLTDYAWSAPSARAPRQGPWARLLGLADEKFLHDRIVRVRSRWTILEAPSPPWRISTVMTVEPPGGPVSLLPDAGLPFQRGRHIPPPAAGERLDIESAFVIPDGVQVDNVRLRWSVSAGARGIPPEFPGKPGSQAKVAVSAPIPLFRAGPGG
jgi:hypothetical protein